MIGDSLWSFLIIAGPIVLMAALAFAMLRNRRTPRQEAKTEAATRELYRQEAADDRTSAK